MNVHCNVILKSMRSLCSQFEEVFMTKREHYEKLVNGKFSKSLVVL